MKNLLVTLSLALLSFGAAASSDAMMEIQTFQIHDEQQMKFFGQDQIIPKPGSNGSGSTNAGSGSGTAATDVLNPDVLGSSSGGSLGGLNPGGVSGPGPLDQVGQAIYIAHNVVALGEQVYTLVQRGKPTVTTEYAPISIVPMDPISKEIVNPFDMDDCAVPQQKKYRTIMKSGSSEVVNFEYAVIYSAGCSYNGVGKYIQTLTIVPSRIKVGYGWDVTAQMKLTGLMNHGNRENPNVGALITIKYTMKSWRTALEKNDTIHVTGAGILKAYSVE